MRASDAARVPTEVNVLVARTLCLPRCRSQPRANAVKRTAIIVGPRFTCTAASATNIRRDRVEIFHRTTRCPAAGEPKRIAKALWARSQEMVGAKR